jgi:hypothetical protein
MKDEPFFEFGTKENNSKLSDKTVGSANQSWEFHQLYEKKDYFVRHKNMDTSLKSETDLFS